MVHRSSMRTRSMPSSNSSTSASVQMSGAEGLETEEEVRMVEVGGWSSKMGTGARRGGRGGGVEREREIQGEGPRGMGSGWVGLSFGDIVWMWLGGGGGGRRGE